LSLVANPLRADENTLEKLIIDPPDGAQVLFARESLRRLHQIAGRVSLNGRGDWEIALPNQRERVTCETRSDRGPLSGRAPVSSRRRSPRNA